MKLIYKDGVLDLDLVARHTEKICVNIEDWSNASIRSRKINGVKEDNPFRVVILLTVIPKKSKIVYECGTLKEAIRIKNKILSRYSENRNLDLTCKSDELVGSLKFNGQIINCSINLSENENKITIHLPEDVNVRNWSDAVSLVCDLKEGIFKYD